QGRRASSLCHGPGQRASGRRMPAGQSKVAERDSLADRAEPSRRCDVANATAGSNWKWWVFGGLLLFAGGFTAYFLAPLAHLATPAASAGEPGHETEQDVECACVEVIQPSAGGVERTTTQPGSVQAYERARLYAA